MGARIIELVYTARDLVSFAQELNCSGPPFRWIEGRRFLLKSELDAALFHLYGLTRDDVIHVLGSFWTLKRKEEQRHGEFRTKRVILETYDAMAIAIATGRPYQTVLDPPPGHGPRHPDLGGPR
jgi:hypothetical protein